MRGGFRLHLDAEAPLQLGDRHLDVQLALAGEQQLLGLRVARVADASDLPPAAGASRVLILSSSPRLFGSIAYADHRLRELDRREPDRDGLVAEHVVRERVLQLGDGAEIAGLDLRARASASCPGAAADGRGARATSAA